MAEAPWLAVHLRLPHDVASAEAEAADLLGNALFELGAQGIEWRDETLPVEAVAAFPVKTELEAESLAARIRVGLRDSGIVAELSEIRLYEEVDWSTHWRGLYRPLSFGDLSVVPSWLEPPPGAVHVLRIDPSSAFGTGIHPTTALCLEWLVERRPRTALDVGTGTGILALAAVALGAERAVGIDNDPEAIRVALENQRLNGVSGARLELSEARLADVRERFDAVLANILAGTLTDLAPLLSDRVRAGGSLVLSGLLVHQVDSVALAYEAEGLVPDQLATQGEWARVTLMRPGSEPAAGFSSPT